MCTTFTEHVRNFGPDCDLVSCVLPRLERVLRRQMARRQLLSAPPAYLGYPELKSWHAAGAFEDLLADCYLFAIARRIVGLRNQLRVRADIEGLVTANVRNFLFERQRRSDRIGYAVFGNVEQAVTSLEEEAVLVVEGCVDGRLDSSSVSRYRSRPDGEPADPTVLREALEAASGWSEALPHLVSTSDEGQRWLAGFIRLVESRGASGFRVSDLVSVLAARARADWDARNSSPAAELGPEGGADDVVRVVRLVQPDPSTDNRDRWEMWKRAVPGRISRVEDPEHRRRLAAEFDALVRMIEAGSTPSQADLIRELGLARSTVSRDFSRMREMLEEIMAGPGTVTGEGG